jgi:hypothetical protein
MGMDRRRTAKAFKVVSFSTPTVTEGGNAR